MQLRKKIFKMLKCTMRKRRYFKEVIKTSSFFPTTWLTLEVVDDEIIK